MKVLSLLCLLPAASFGLSMQEVKAYRTYVDKEINLCVQKFLESQSRYQKRNMSTPEPQKATKKNIGAMIGAFRRFAYALLMSENTKHEIREKYQRIDEHITELKQIWGHDVEQGIMLMQDFLNPQVESGHDVVFGTIYSKLAVMVDWKHPVIRKYVVESWREARLPVGPNW